MPFLFFLFILGAVVVFFVIAKKQAERRREAWQSVARDLGFIYIPGDLFKVGVLTGQFGESVVTTDIHTVNNGKNSHQMTRYKLEYPSLGLGLRLSRQGIMDNLGKMFGGQDIEIGDAEFDRLLLVRGSDPERVREFLTPERRETLMNAFNVFTKLVVTDQEAVIETYGQESSEARLKGAIGCLHRLAETLGVGSKPRAQQKTKVMERKEAKPSAPAPSAVEFKPFIPAAAPATLSAAPAHTAPATLSAAPAHTAPATLSAPPPTPSEAPAAVIPVPAPAATGELTAAALSAELFGGSTSSFDVEKKFVPYIGKTVRWSGKLENVRQFGSDFTFKNGAGTKAIVLVHELSNQFGFKNPVKAVVRFKPEDYATLNPLAGQPLEFSGRLLKADGMVRELYLEDGAVEA